jgi:hypothetical protein
LASLSTFCLSSRDL